MMSGAESGGRPAVPGGLFDHPLQTWPNDDLLLTEQKRAYIRQYYPALFPVLDWKELREIFVRHETEAVPARRTSRRQGTRALILGTVGLGLAAVATLLSVGSIGAKVLGVTAALASVSGLAIGFNHVLDSRDRRVWLRARYQAERTRQFYFQFLLNHLCDAVHAAADSEALDDYRSLRDTALARFQSDHLDQVGTCYGDVLSDFAESDVWIREAQVSVTGAAKSSLPPFSERLFGDLLEVLRIQRIGIQGRYTKLKKVPSLYSAATRALYIDRTTDALTFLVMLLALVIGVLTAWPKAAPSGGLPAFAPLVAASAIMSALIAGLRALSDGLRLGEETDRYRWYGNAVEMLEERFDRSEETDEKLGALRELEVLSYRELRTFLVSHNRARFLLQ